MTNSAYKPAAFPFTVGGGPGAVSTVTLTVTATDSESTPIAAVADRAAYFAANAATQAKHDRFTNLVMWFEAYGQPISASVATGSVLTLSYDQKGLHANSTLGVPAYTTKVQRPDAYLLAQAFITAQGVANDINAITVTVDGASQSS